VKKFENQLGFDKVITISLVVRFLGTQCICTCLCRLYTDTKWQESHQRQKICSLSAFVK